MSDLQSYKPYARLVTLISAIIIFIASLDASQVVTLFPQYASEINTILVIAGVLAPAIMQEQRVVRAEDIVKDTFVSQEDSGDGEIEDSVNVYLTLDGQEVIKPNSDDDDDKSA